jgi:gamma-butyrobetaine dioxygenase
MSKPQSSSSVHEPRVDMKDLANHATDRVILGIQWDARSVVLSWDDGRTSVFHATWLRDNCACDACRHPKTLERTFLLIEHPGPIRIATAALCESGALRVTFDGADATPAHASEFDAGWLRRHCYSHAARQERQTYPHLWAAADLPELPAFRYDALMHDDLALQAWLQTLLDSGIVVVNDMPAAVGYVQRLAERVGPLRPTSFGTTFEVESKPDPNNSAYTALGLELHSDIPNVPYPPSVQFLHCIVNDAAGGGSILVDGFRVAEELRRVDEAGFRLLASEPIEFRFHDEKADLRHRAAVFSLDRQDRVVEVRFNNWIRSTLDLPAERVEPYYAALLHYWRLLREPRFERRLRLEAGQAIVFDNRRVLHGREAFDPSSGGRLLQGCYLDREWVESRLRLLQRR